MGCRITNAPCAQPGPHGQGAGLDEVIDRVAVPGGNTAAGLDAAHNGLNEAWKAAFVATADNEVSKSVPRLGPERSQSVHDG